MPHAALLRAVTAGYGDRPPVLDRADLDVAPGEVVAIMGPSGTGKSTLLGVVSGLVVARGGEVVVAGHDLTTLSAAQRAAVRRRHLGLVFQSPDLLPELSVAENVAVTLVFDGVRRRDALRSARAALESVHLADLADRRIDEVSGGEAQRVALARALVRTDLALLVADEPTASLDQANAGHVARLLVDAVRSRGAGGLLATHDPRVAALADRTVHIGQSSPQAAA